MNDSLKQHQNPTVLPGPNEATPSAKVEKLADEMARRWQMGEKPLVEEFLVLHPWLADHPEAALDLIAEELHLRQENGQDLADLDLGQRFPQWQRQVEALLDCHRLLALAPARFPSPGEVLGDFRLLAELGRGAHGRVFLASQPTLADRPVVLKLTPSMGREHLSLARLQHTHIVPLYSAHEFPSRGLRGLCLPYFGGTTLSNLLTLIAGVPPSLRTGSNLLEALRKIQNAAPVSLKVNGLACEFLAHASYVRAACWLGACLADALQYAQDRGLVHLDLKPSNVLVAADGQPMLLDFHLAREPIACGMDAPAWLGGTPGYMAPEQAAAMTAAAERRPLALAVDGRTDVFALGMLLHETLAGGPPDWNGNLARDLAKRNPHVPTSLADLLARCLAEDAASRYSCAGELAADLRRHLANLPLRGVPNRDPLERWRKWRRRRPLILPLLALLAASTTIGLFLADHFHRQTAKAFLALHEGEEFLSTNRTAEALEALKRGKDLAEDLPGAGDLIRKLHEQSHWAERQQAVAELHQFCESVRPLLIVNRLRADQVRAVASRCDDLWKRREIIIRLLGFDITTDTGSQVCSDLLDVAILKADLEARMASREEQSKAQEHALDILREARDLLGPHYVLHQEREALLISLGRKEEAETLSHENAPEPNDAWEYCTRGRGYLRIGDLIRASADLDRSLELQPHALWPHFLKGSCDFRLRKFEDALVNFSVCVVLAPHSAWCFHNRGLVYARLGRSELALRDFNHALRLDSSFADAAFARGTLHLTDKRYREALADLHRALDLGWDAVSVYCQQAIAEFALGNHEAALASLDNAVRLEPGCKQALDLLELYQEKP